MKIILIVLIILFFCVSFNSIFAEDINSINRKLKTDISEIRQFKLRELNSTIINKGKSEHKNFQTHKFTINDKNFKPTDDTGIWINKKKYFVAKFIPSNTKRINQNDKVKAYTLFNVLYYLEKRRFPCLEISSISLGTIGLWAGNFSSYKNAENSSDAEKYRKQSKILMYCSLAALGNFGYQLYNNYDELGTYRNDQKLKNTLLSLTAAILISSGNLYLTNYDNYQSTTNSSNAQKYKKNSKIFAGISIGTAIILTYQLIKNRDALFVLDG